MSHRNRTTDYVMTTAYQIGERTVLALFCTAFLVGCGGRDDRATAGDQALPVTATSPAPATTSPPVLKTLSESREFKDWKATCGNDGACWAFGFAPEFEAGWVRVSLQPGPDARPEVRFGYWPDGVEPELRQIDLKIDSRTFSARPDEENESGGPIGEIQSDARPVIDAMAHGSAMIISGATTQAVSLQGAAAALLWIDEKQQRLGTPTALIRKGDRPTSAVPIAPALPAVMVAPAADQMGFDRPNQQLPAALLARPEVQTCLEDSVMPDVRDMAQSYRLDDKTELWAVPCGTGAYNLTHYWYVTGKGGRSPRPTALIGASGPGGDPASPDNGTVNGEYDPKTRLLSAFAMGRGLGDCGTMQTWAWTGSAFVLAEERSMGVCAGVPAELWAVAWRTR